MWFLIILLGITSVVGYVSHHLFTLIVVSGESMEPTLRSGDTIWLRKDSSDYYIGDIVVADIIENDETVRVIKRIVARYPATISISNLGIHIDGKEIIVIAYYPINLNTSFTFKMKTNEFFLFGDNHKMSDYYFITKDQIVGRGLGEYK